MNEHATNSSDPSLLEKDRSARICLFSAEVAALWKLLPW